MLRVAHPPGWEPERRYAADVFFGEFLGLEVEHARTDGGATEVTVGPGSPRLLLADGLFALPDGQRLSASTLPHEPLARFEPPAELGLDSMPVLYGAEPFVDAREDELRIGLDVLGSAFFLLSRYEEAVGGERDDRDRFPASASIATRERFLDRPLVDELSVIVRSALARLWPRLEVRRRAFSVLPSHDVDFPRDARRPLIGLASELKHRRPGAAAARVRSLLTGRDPFDTFDYLMDESERRGLRSSFYFLAGGRSPLDGHYSLDDEWIRSLLRRIHERGHEIGLHTSYETFRDPEQTSRERAALAAVCAAEGIEQERWGGRQHYLRWDNPVTWQNWEDAGLDYDTTLGFHDEPGFRCGTCHEFPVFNVATRQRLRLRERPLVAMERTLLTHLGTSVDEAAARLRMLKDRCRFAGGAFALLWHNSELVDPRDRRLYERALDA